jgi:hypothetical protein
MDDQAIRTLDMLKRGRVFGDAHLSSFSPVSLARQLFLDIGHTITEIEGHAAAESAAGGSKRQSTAGKAVAREALRELMEAIRRTARAMALTMPGLEDKFRIPRGNNDQILLNTARAFAQEALALKDEFIRHEMPPDFIERLNAAIANMEAAIGVQTTAKGASKSAGVSIDEAIGRGLEAVRRLDPIVRNKFADQPTVIAEWDGARRIQRGPRSQPVEGGNSTNNQPPTQ